MNKVCKRRTRSATKGTSHQEKGRSTSESSSNSEWYVKLLKTPRRYPGGTEEKEFKIQVLNCRSRVGDSGQRPNLGRSRAGCQARGGEDP